LLVAVVGDAQMALLVTTTDTTSPSTKLVVVNVALLLPDGVAFTNHAYVGEAPALVGVAVNVTEVPAQIGDATSAAMLTDGATNGLTVMVTLLLNARFVDVQSALLVNSRLTTSPVTKVELEYDRLVATELPFTNHSYVGAVPSLVGVAENVTRSPSQTELDGDAAMLTVGVTIGFTVILMILLAAGLPVGHDMSLVNVTCILLVPVKALVVNVSLLVPAGDPLTVHAYTGLAPPLVGVAVNSTSVPAQIGDT